MLTDPPSFLLGKLTHVVEVHVSALIRHLPARGATLRREASLRRHDLHEVIHDEVLVVELLLLLGSLGSAHTALRWIAWKRSRIN